METAGSSLLATLMRALPVGRRVRFHLTGHSFGCIVVVRMMNGPRFPSLWGVIQDGGGASGTHSDNAKPEVAHAMWEAVKST